MSFVYEGRVFELFDHPYNATLTNERAVEIPIARAFLTGCVGEGLEVGNVLGHYDESTPRNIVDKYERGRNVSNLDVFDIVHRYDWIVSVSTIEHVRQGDDGDNDWAAAAALLYLRGLLNPGGRMLVTVGLGQNPTLDRFLASTGQGITYRRWRHVDPRKNSWAMVSPAVFVLPYGPEHGANAVWIGEWQA